MPNTGRPSQDCHLCRSRRVKCDLARPACQRCTKYGAECPGYRDQQDLIFRNADPARAKKRKSRLQQHQQSTRPGALLSPAPSSSSSLDYSGPSTPSAFLDEADPVTSVSGPGRRALAVRHRFARDEALHLYAPLNEHWTAHSIPIMLNVYGPIDFLKNMFRTYAKDGPLIWAAHLFARTYVTNLRYPTSMSRESYEETQRELGMYLGKVLCAVGTALQAPGGAMRDDILATVWTLANYELMVGCINRPHLTSPWHTHARGLYTMLKTRGVESLKRDASRAAFWSSYAMVQIDCLASSLPCPPESQEWFQVIKSTILPGEQQLVIVSEFICKLAGLQATMLAIIRRNDFETACDQYHALIDGIVEAENEADIQFTRVTDSASFLDVFWRQNYCSALVKGYHIAQLYINLLSHYRPCPIPTRELETRREYCLQRVRSASQEILDSAPAVLAPLINNNDRSPRMLFDAMMVVWPLSAVYVVSSTLPDQKSTAEMALLFIGRGLGIRQALSTYPGSTAARVPIQAQTPNGFGECEMVAWVGRLR